MAESHEHVSRTGEQTDAVAQLIRTAGRREGPPAAVYERALAAATAVWDAKVRRRSRHRSFAAVAASIVLASITVYFIRTVPPGAQLAAGHTDRIVGAVELQSGDGAWTALKGQSMDLRVRDRLRTAVGSQAGIVLADGTSLRLADATEVIFESARRVRLLAGKVYVDTAVENRASTASQVEVVTAMALATDIGTQFEVSYRGSEYRLRVREGRVRLRHEAGAVDSDAGEQIKLNADGLVERARVSSDDVGWAWAQQVAPDPQIDGRAVSVLLAWVARETGKTVRFESPEAERKARTTILHGHIRLLTPLDALAVMLAATDLEHVLTEDDAILIRLKHHR